MGAITEASIRELAAFRSDAPVVSCYLDVDGSRQVLRQDYEKRLDAMVRRAQAGPDGAAAAADLDRVVDYVHGSFDRSGVRGLALFSCVADDLWEVVPLPVPVKGQLVVNRSPVVGQLEMLVQELVPLGVLLVDRQRARLFVYHFGQLEERAERFDELLRDYDRRDDAGRGHEREQQHADELATQHLRRAADVAFELYQEDGFGRLAVGGADDVAAAVESMLHPYLQERLVGRIPVTVTASEAEIRDAALELEHRAERRKEQDTVDRLRDAAGAGARGVTGLAATLAALNERRVHVLLVSDGYEEVGWRCPSCGLLAATGPQCPVDGAAMDHLDDVVAAAVEAGLLQGRVEMCVENADLDVLGRIGALLRY